MWNENYFTDLVNQSLQGLGLGSGSDAAKTIGSQIKNQFGSGNEQAQQSNVAPPNPISASNPDSDVIGAASSFSLASMGLPMILVGGVAAYFLLKKR